MNKNLFSMRQQQGAALMQIEEYRPVVEIWLLPLGHLTKELSSVSYPLNLYVKTGRCKRLQTTSLVAVK